MEVTGSGQTDRNVLIQKYSQMFRMLAISCYLTRFVMLSSLPILLSTELEIVQSIKRHVCWLVIWPITFSLSVGANYSVKVVG